MRADKFNHKLYSAARKGFVTNRLRRYEGGAGPRPLNVLLARLQVPEQPNRVVLVLWSAVGHVNFKLHRNRVSVDSIELATPFAM